VVLVDAGGLYVFPQSLPKPPTGSGVPVPGDDGNWMLKCEELGATAEIVADSNINVDDLVVRGRRPGDRLFDSSKRLKSLLIDKKVPRPYRDFFPVLAKGDQIISAPNVLSCRHQSLNVRWVLDEKCPILDIDFL